jgi:hypothetical protein
VGVLLFAFSAAARIVSARSVPEASAALDSAVKMIALSGSQTLTRAGVFDQIAITKDAGKNRQPVWCAASSPQGGIDASREAMPVVIH